MFKKIFFNFVLNGLTLGGVTYFIPEIHYTGGIAFFALGGIVMGFLNSIVKPILKLLTLPVQIITLGLSLIVVNGIIFWIFKIIIDTIAVAGISLTVDTFKTYFLAGFLFGVMNWLIHILIPHS